MPQFRKTAADASEARNRWGMQRRRPEGVKNETLNALGVQNRDVRRKRRPHFRRSAPQEIDGWRRSASPTSINCKRPATGPDTIWKNPDGCSRGAKSAQPAAARARRCQKRDAKRVRRPKSRRPAKKASRFLTLRTAGKRWSATQRVAYIHNL